MKKHNLIALLSFISFLLSFLNISAQPAEKLVKVIVSPSHDNWKYKVKENAKFEITVWKNNVKLNDLEIQYKISEDTMDPRFEGRTTLKNGSVTIDGGTMTVAGFLRCSVTVTYDGRKYSGMATAGFDVENIQPTVTVPDDFLSFWENAKKDAAKIPMEPKITFIPEKCTSTVNVYHVSIQNYQYGSRIYGMLAIPKAPGKYPAILHAPGAGIRPYNADVNNAAKGFITLVIGIHGVPVNLNNQVYQDLSRAALNEYYIMNLDNKDKFYYKRVYLGCIRSLDFIYSLPEFDGENMIVQGGSQGGALSIVTAALDNRVKGIVAFYPAMCDMTGYIHGRAGGWPGVFRDKSNSSPEKIETIRYYDVVNFAKQLKVPGFYSLGFNDVTCPPTSMYAAYNSITAPKELMLIQELGHFSFPEQWEESNKWIMNFVGKK